MYSAFHLPFRFDNATRTVIDTVAGRGLQAARTLRINYNAIVNVTSAGPVNEWLATAHAVETNSYISTSITFTLVNSTCSDSAEHAASAANGLSVRQIYSHDNRDVVGWGIVVGDPAVMAKTKTGTMRPCTAVLQATDSITGEILTVAIINASVKNCFDNGNPNKLVDTQSLSCNGHGTCNLDLNPYDGIFKGCNCSSSYLGDRCEIKQSKQCNLGTRKHEAFNTKSQAL